MNDFQDTQPHLVSAGNKAQDIEERNVDSQRSIGDLIAARRHLTADQVTQIVTAQQERGLKFGEAAVALNLADQGDVLWALSQQFHYPYAPEPGSVSPELVVANNPFGTQAESFRDLRSQILLGPLNGEAGRRALAVVSPDIGDGKSFFVANLAVAFSQLGGRTLLVDADMRTPRQHQVFGVAAGAGLSSILAGRGGEQAIQPVKALSNLYVLPVGTVPPNPLELVQRPAFTLMLHELLAKFDFVLVDTPAAVHGSDMRVIAARCGAALAVGRRDRTRIDAMKALVDGFHKTPCRLAGVVMNEH